MKNIKYKLSSGFYLQLLLILISFNVSHSQVTEVWVAKYNGPANGIDEAKEIAVDNAGNVYVTGWSFGELNNDFATIKYNSAGVQQWVQRYNGPGNSSDNVNAIVIDDLGNVYVTGDSYGSGNNPDYATIKYNSAGVQQWVARYNGPNNNSDYARSIEVDGSGNVYVTGMSSGVGSNFDYATIKYNSAGVEQWVARYNGPGNSSDNAQAIAVDVSGNVYITGDIWGSGSNSDYGTIKYSSAGNQQWVAMYNGPGNLADVANSIAVDGSGNVFVTGTSRNATNPDYATIKYNSAGVQQWVQRYNGPANSDDLAISLVIDNSANVYVTGNSSAGIGFGYDYATIKYNSDGAEQWNQRYNGPGNFSDDASSIAVDGLGYVYVTGTSQGSSSNLDYATIKYNSTGNTEWVQRYNGSDNLVDWATSIVVDNSKNVYVTGWSDDNETGSDFATIKYSQSLNITSPVAGDKWFAEKPDTIRWTTDIPRNIEIFFSNYGDDEYTLIAIVGEQETFYVWNPPDNFHSSSNAKIKIADALAGTINDISEPFSYRAFDLVRLSNQEIEVFSPASHGWSFPNEDLIMWPPDWYQQFDYRNVNDPFTGQPYRADFLAITRPQPSDFPDWPLFVETFGREKCYEGNRPTQRAMEAWKALKEDWSGSCFGFPVSSMLAFEHLTSFINLNPGIPSTPSIFNLFFTNTIRKTVNKYYLYQNDASEITNSEQSSIDISPRDVLAELKEMFLDENANHTLIALLNNSDPGAHTLLPFKLMRDEINSEQFKLFVYDSNEPGETGEFILIDSLANTWEEFLTIDYGSGNNGLYLTLPSSHFLQTPVLSLLEEPAISKGGLDRVTIYNTTHSSNFIISENGDTLGYGNGRFLRQIPGGFPIIPAVAVEHPPIGYRTDNADYKIQLSDFTDSISSILIHKDNIIYNYERLDATPFQTDNLILGSSLRVKNSDTETKQINLKLITADFDMELTYDIRLSQPQDDSAAIKNVGNNFKFINEGSNKAYDLRIRYLWNYGENIFGHQQIFIEGSSSHTILAIDSLQNIVEILIDLGNNGTIDDTLHLNNTVNVEDEVSLLSPNEYNLAQNYPNPFNPVTTIQYSIPQRSDVVLKVYDILGNELTTLVNEEKERGVYTATFDATSLASGLYLYRLQAGSFVETKKMLLIK